MLSSGVLGYKFMEYVETNRLERAAGVYAAAWNGGSVTNGNDEKLLALKRKLTINSQGLMLNRKSTRFW